MTDCRVGGAAGVVEEGECSVGCHLAAGGVGKEGKRSIGRVVEAGGVAQKCPSTNGRIFGSVPRLVSHGCKKRPSAHSSIELAFSIAPE